MRFTSIILASVALLAASPASAATLTSLLAGGSITVGDVTFNSFAADPGDTGNVATDTDAIDVTGGSSANTVWLDFAFDPSLQVSGDIDAIGYVLDFLASVDAPSMRSFISATLSFFGDDLDITNDASSGVNMVLDGAVFLSIFDDSIGGTQNSDTMAVGPSGSVSAETQWNLIGFETAAIARMSGFRFTLTLDDDIAPPAIPLPAAAPLFFAGLGALGLIRRRRKGLI